MAQSLTAAFDPNMISTFKRGIQSRDVKKVKAALDAGVDPATPLANSTSVLFELLYRDYDSNARVQNMMDDETYDQNTAEIVDMLLQRGLKLTEPGKHETALFDCLLDHFMDSDRLGEVSNLVVHGLYEGLRRDGRTYQPRIKAQLAAFLERQEVTSESDLTSCYNHVMNMMEAIHNTVRARIQSPRSKMERKLIQEFDDRLGYWKGPFPRPSLASLLKEMDIAIGDVTALAGNKQDQGGQKQNGPQQPPQQQQQQKTATGDQFAEQMAPLVQKLEKRDAKQILAEIDESFVGLEKVKASARQIMLRQQFDMARSIGGHGATQQSHSTVFLGNPGLGKTTFARKKAELLHSLGLAGPNYVEVSRENVVGGFIGHTEAKMTALFQLADVIFIDEAYNLAESGSSNDFGKRVIDSLLTALENKPNLTVFMAGYPAEMEKLLSSNPGLRSRLTRFDTFEDMTNEQLGQTLDYMLSKEALTVEPAARAHILEKLDACRSELGEKSFGNARLVRNIVRALPDQMAERMFGAGANTTAAGILAVPDDATLSRVTLADVKALDYKAVLGTGKAQAAQRDLPANDPNWQPKIGFTAKI